MIQFVEGLVFLSQDVNFIRKSIVFTLLQLYDKKKAGRQHGYSHIKRDGITKEFPQDSLPVLWPACKKIYILIIINKSVK